MKILLAIDGSSYSKKMLAYLVTHDELFTPSHSYAALTVLPPVPPRVTALVGHSAVQPIHTADADSILQPVDKFLRRHGIAAKCSWKAGPAGDTIARFAAAGKYDLIVMGSHGHGTVLNVVMGSVATRVLAQSKLPVLLVR